MTLAQMQAELAEGLADPQAGRVVPLDVIFAELNAAVIEAERNRLRMAAVQAAQ